MVLDHTLPGTPPDNALHALTKRHDLKATCIFKKAGAAKHGWRSPHENAEHKRRGEGARREGNRNKIEVCARLLQRAK